VGISPDFFQIQKDLSQKNHFRVLVGQAQNSLNLVGSHGSAAHSARDPDSDPDPRPQDEQIPFVNGFIFFIDPF
jgi:hypothetical protein